MFWKLIVLCTLVLLLFGCGTMNPEQRTDFRQNDAMYRNWGHLWYSWAGYRNQSCDPRIQNRSRDEGWWGATVHCE